MIERMSELRERMISFDQEKCTRCDICVLLCPAGIIKREENKEPYIPEDLLGTCRKCGHCEVFCPSDAVQTEYQGNYPRQDAEIAVLEPEALENHLLSRRTTRAFLQKPVEKETMIRIMDTVRFSPSASNKQPIKWKIINGPEKVRALSVKVAAWMSKTAETDRDHPYAPVFKKAADELLMGNDIISRNAPSILITLIPSESALAENDSSIALAWFEILSQSYGIGTCWLGLLKLAIQNDPSLLEDYEIPQGYKFGDAMSFGYPKYRVYSLPRRNSADIDWI